MGWGLIIPEVFLSKIHKDDIEEKLDNNNEIIHTYEGELIALTTYSHSTIKDGEEEISIIDYAPRRIKEIMDSLEELYSENKLLYIAIEKKDELRDE